ncbi:MAG TPA: hypothetical protein VHT91_20750 [Kofleriaceae bacterium]|jgi:nucleoside phosphorylase|nr:hypothetical protein [Kofleriaceae bacterium]
MQVDAVDIVIVTVIPAELAAARSAFRVGGRTKAPSGTLYYRGALPSKIAQRDYAIAVVCIGQPGNPAAAAAVTEAIALFRPQALFLLGIGGGLRGATRIGDAVFSERIVAYEPAAVTGSRRRPRVAPRPDTERPAHAIQQDLTHWLADGERDSRLADRFQALGAKPTARRGQTADFRAHVSKPVFVRAETFASGEKLIRHPHAFQELRKIHDKIKVVEMEASGLIEACRRASLPWLVVRGISDFGDRFKDDRFHEYASLTAAVALADFITEALQLAPDASRFDDAAYLAGVRAELARTTATARPRTSVTPAQTAVSFASTIDGFVPEGGQLHFLTGASGRGKTTALALAAAAAIARTPLRYPLFVHLDDHATWIDLVRGTTGAPAAVDDAALRAWFERTPTLVIVDDWHRASDAARAHFEAILAALLRASCAILIAGGESIAPPRIPDTRHLRLPPWSAQERDAIIDHTLGSPSGASSWVRQRLSPGLYELLLQPVLLAKFLEMVRRTSLGGTQLPRDLPELFDRLLVALLSSIHSDATRRCAEVTAVCGILAGEPGPITLPTIAAALAASGIARDASQLADDLYAAGVWKRTGASFAFEHEIWRTYFLATALQSAPAWSDLTALAIWIGTTPLPELEQLMPFATGMIRTPALQRAMLDAAMHRDLRLYCLSLRTRATVELPAAMPALDRARHVLGELHAGYFGLVDRYFPALRSSLRPWCDGDGDEPSRGEKPVVVGTATETDLGYFLGFAPVSGPDVVIEEYNPGRGRSRHAPRYRHSRHGMRLGDDLRSDSTRLVGARLLLEELTRLCENRHLPPVGWIARERFRSLVRIVGSDGHLGRDYQLRTVASILGWANEQLSATGADDILIARPSWNSDNDPPGLRALIELGRDLRAAGLGDTPISDLGLPGPDLLLPGGYFSNGYSSARKLERIAALYRAVTETYHALYEQYFVGLARHTHYAQFPARANVRILPDTPHGPTSVELWWEVVATWAAASPQVSAVQRPPTPGSRPSPTSSRPNASDSAGRSSRSGAQMVTRNGIHGSPQ